MGFFSRLFGAPASQSEFECGADPKTCIFDVASLTESAAKNGTAPSPRENFDALKTLAQFAAQEGLNLIAVFTGRPLREASDGATFKNVKVHYAENAAACRKTVMRLVQACDGGRGALVVTADAELERLVIAQGADCMRGNTFKKALDNRDGRDNRDNRDGRDGREGRDNRDPRRQSRPPRRGGNGNNNGNNNSDGEDDRKDEATEDDASESQPQKRGAPGPDDPKKEILDLIDPI